MAANLSLHAGGRGWALVDEGGNRAELGLDPGRLASRHWPDGRPSAIAVERAIDDVESAIESTGWRHAERGHLRLAVTVSAFNRRSEPAAGLLPRDAVESAFTQWVASLALDTAMPGEVAAQLLMLRELMHHLGLQQLQLST